MKVLADESADLSLGSEGVVVESYGGFHLHWVVILTNLILSNPFTPNKVEFLSEKLNFILHIQHPTSTNIISSNDPSYGPNPSPRPSTAPSPSTQAIFSILPSSHKLSLNQRYQYAQSA